MPKFEVVFTQNIAVIVDAPNATAADRFTNSNVGGIINGTFGNIYDMGWYQVEGMPISDDADFSVSVNENGDVI